MVRLILLGAIALVYAVACWLSPFSWMADPPRVEKVAELPETAAGLSAAQSLGESGVFYRMDRPDLSDTPSKVVIGYSFRELELLKLPLIARDQSFVLYSESREGRQVLPLDAQAQRTLVARIGNDPFTAYRFPWWRYMWGLAFVLAMLVWLVFEFRHEAGRRGTAAIR